MVGVFLSLAGVTGITSCAFYIRRLAREQRGRATAIGCYASAPLLAASLLFATCVLIMLLSLPRADLKLEQIWDASSEDGWGIMLLAAIVVLSYEWSALTMLRLVTRCRWTRIACLALLLPLAWAIVLLVVPGTCEFLLAFIDLIVRSFSEG